jgi:hypothetical protein
MAEFINSIDMTIANRISIINHSRLVIPIKKPDIETTATAKK